MDWDEGQERPIRPCDRCGCGAGDEADMQRPEPMMGEIQLAFGLTTWICHDCRKDWHRIFKEHPLNRRYSHASLELEFWKARVGENTPQEELKKGLELFDKIEDLELEINKAANEWLLGVDEVRTL
jgi:hypothetical protein